MKSFENHVKEDDELRLESWVGAILEIDEVLKNKGPLFVRCAELVRVVNQRVIELVQEPRRPDRRVLRMNSLTESIAGRREVDKINITREDGCYALYHLGVASACIVCNVNSTYFGRELLKARVVQVFHLD
jgi:hypothetical protein